VKNAQKRDVFLSQTTKEKQLASND